MVGIARILSGVLCGVFTIGVIANLIAMTLGNRIGATGLGLAGLAAHWLAGAFESSRTRLLRRLA